MMCSDSFCSWQRIILLLHDGAGTTSGRQADRGLEGSQTEVEHSESCILRGKQRLAGLCNQVFYMGGHEVGLRSSGVLADLRRTRVARTRKFDQLR